FTAGNYVQDGEQLAEITDTKSFAFILDLPYELKPYLSLNQSLQLRLPDSTVLQGYVQSALPTVDSIAQTQRFIIKVNTDKLIPENLMAKVSLVKEAKQNATTLPKEAVLSNEEQTEFWIMQLMNDSTAVKMPVQKGIEKNDEVEILSPPLNDSTRILLTGNYGLPDTAKINIIK
ncbi:MAG: HlyD family efflux transporter periplasmic adaptor subunit, partial [Parafilimonas sp.]